MQRGDRLDLIGFAVAGRSIEVIQVTSNGTVIDAGRAGDLVGCCLRRVDPDLLVRGQVLAAPDSINASASFDADVRLLATKIAAGIQARLTL
jgi:elongation factor Tu